jgi:ABC-type transport system involved in cytochrome c biogenesis permease component
METKIERKVTQAPQQGSRVLRIGLVASGAATLAFLLTYCIGNRDLGFGRSISQADQKLLLIAASLLFVGFIVASLVSRQRAFRVKRSGNDEI